MSTESAQEISSRLGTLFDLADRPFLILEEPTVLAEAARSIRSRFEEELAEEVAAESSSDDVSEELRRNRLHDSVRSIGWLVGRSGMESGVSGSAETIRWRNCRLIRARVQKNARSTRSPLRNITEISPRS